MCRSSCSDFFLELVGSVRSDICSDNLLSFFSVFAADTIGSIFRDIFICDLHESALQ